MPDILMHLDGINGQLELYNDKIIIKRKGALPKIAQGSFREDKTIYLKQITSIQVKPGNIFTNGYIQFSLPGGNDSTKGLINATQDENTIMFVRKHNSVVEEIKNKIEHLQSTLTMHQEVSSADEPNKI
ncbi:MAG: DUF4429 domain-containing protein [Syntrophomonadaceae bacterium]|nr:DUF4429 domain-containing protein [Syntrophomonadaceae bacterium]